MVLVLAMQSQGGFSGIGFLEGIKHFSASKWTSLTDRQKKYAKKAWRVMTYKWRWQIAMNVPYLGIFILDKTVPSVHQFDMALLSKITSTIPIPAFISSWIGLA